MRPDCAIEGCYRAMTTWSIYCDGHDYLDTFAENVTDIWTF